MTVLLYSEVRTFIADTSENNHLLDGLEFTDARVRLAMEMSADSYGSIPPISTIDLIDVLDGLDVIGIDATTLRSKAIFLYGTLWHLFAGQSALTARNQMSYSDGGLTIPIEERYQFYVQLAAQYEQNFKTATKDLKIAMNLENGWAFVPSDYSTFPIW
tara:strand:+ start:142 stop:618 length:477 start_codon:yes stop_codon:yes gene_type:complete